MSSLLPLVPQQDLEHFRLITTNSGFGLKALYRPQDAEISLKLLTRNDMTENELHELLKDVARARCIQSRRILPVIGFYQYQGLRGLVTEWMFGGSLHSLIHQRDIYPELPLCMTARILSDVAEGLCHLHSLSPPLVHQGLKPSNILLDTAYRAKTCITLKDLSQSVSLTAVRTSNQRDTIAKIQRAQFLLLARISDYGLTHWRKQNLRSVSLSSSNADTSDLVYLSPEKLRGDDPTAAGDVYSFGMTCWEATSRKRPFEGKSTMLKVLTGVSTGLRPSTDEEFIAVPSTTSQRNSLVQLINLCWHTDPNIRPAIGECVHMLQRIMDTFSREMMSSAVYGLIQAKEKAVNACKASSDPHSMQIDLHNLAVSYGQANSKAMLKPKMPVRVRSLTLIPLVGQDYERHENAVHLERADGSARLTEQRQGGPACSARGPALQSCFSTPPTTLPKTGHGDAAAVQRQRSTAATQWHPGYRLTAQHHRSSTPHTEAAAGHCCRGCCCQVLSRLRETIVTHVTEGCLNKILDVLQSHRVLAKADYEGIASYPTLTGRCRALLDTCRCLGEGAAHIVVTVLMSNKCCPILAKQLQLSFQQLN